MISMHRARLTAAFRSVAAYLPLLEKRVTAAETAKHQFDNLSVTARPEAKRIKEICDTWKLEEAGKELESLSRETRSARDSGDWIKAWRILSKLDSRCGALRSLVDAFDKYKADMTKPMLLQGRIAEIQRSLIENNEYSNDAFLNELDKAYTAQCRIPREAWLNTLNISGHNVIELGNDCHITVFNDAVSKNIKTIDVRGTTTEISSALFLLDDISQRVHVTKVVHGADGQAVHYHRYFDSDKAYSENINALHIEEQNTIRKELDGAYEGMIKRFETRIDALRDNHGRPVA